jgi:hypothetical protein
MSSASLTRRAVLARLGLAGLALPAVLHGQPTPAVHSDLQQPHMRAALDALRTAKRHLDLATPDKGGHRAKALDLVNSAITETQDGIAYDATH